MVIYLAKKITGRTRRMLSSYNYEVYHGVFVGAYHTGIYSRILKWLNKNAAKNDRILIIRKNTQTIEGFEEHGINLESCSIDFGGVKLYK